MNVKLIKTLSGLIPYEPTTEAWYQKIKHGAVIHSDFKLMRNPGFHKKMFSLFNLAFEYWEPGEINSKYGKPEKNFERFRKDLTILAGYFLIVIRLDGTAKPEADSLSYGNMEPEVFEACYNNILTVILKRIPVLDKMTKEEIDELVDRFLAFA